MLKKIRNRKYFAGDLESSISKGFTLIETLLYVSMISIMLLVLSAFLFSILQARTKFQTISEVDQVGIQIMQLVTQSIRNSEHMNVPISGNSSATLSLNMMDPEKTPTVFNVSSTTFQMKEGVENSISLTSQKLIVSELLFSNLSAMDAPEIVKFQFTLIYVNPSGRNEYDYTKTFYGSASLRLN